MSAYARRGGKLLQRKMLCSVCSRGFIDRYSKRGHKIRQRSLTRPARMGVLEYLFGRNKRRSRIVV